MNALELRIKEVKKTYKDLPKSKSDEGEFVIIAERDNGGSYDEYKECLGVKENGDLIWSFLSGCSCSGDNEEKKIADITAKVFTIEADETALSFYEKNKVGPTEENYTSY